MTPVEVQIRSALGALAWNARQWRRFRHATEATVCNTRPGVATAVDIPLQFVDFVVEAGCRLAVVVDANDQNYAVESQIGTNVTIQSGPGAQASLVDIPM